MSQTPPTLSVSALRWFGKTPDKLTDRQRRVLERALARRTVSKNMNIAFDGEMTFGERLSAAVEARGRLCVGIDPHRGLLEEWGLPDTVAGLERFAMTATEAFGGVSAATESIATMSTAPERISTSAISSACSPWSGWETSISSMSTPMRRAYAGSIACSVSMKAHTPPVRWAWAMIS